MIGEKLVWDGLLWFYILILSRILTFVPIKSGFNIEHPCLL